MSDRSISFFSTSGEDLIKWQNIIRKFSDEEMDIHFTPEYSRIYELTYGQKSFLAFFGDERDFIISVFMRSTINNLPFLMNHRELPSFFDIESVYGYGGPLAKFTSTNTDTKKSLYSDYLKEFHNYCSENNIVDEYIRFHPLLQNHVQYGEYGGGDLFEVKPIVYLDLRKSNEKLWSEMCRGHRSSVNKARRLGVKISVNDPDKLNLEIFQTLYNETMDRHEADEIWQLTPEYFNNCVNCLGKEHVKIINAEYEDRVIASYFIIHGYQTAYYHFGGSREEVFSLRANNLLLFEIALWAKSEGYRWFHLGGGIKPDDGVYRFKSGFSATTVPLFSAKTIHIPQTYEYLCQLREDSSYRKKSNPQYFPAYKG